MGFGFSDIMLLFFKFRQKLNGVERVRLLFRLRWDPRFGRIASYMYNSSWFDKSPYSQFGGILLLLFFNR